MADPTVSELIQGILKNSFDPGDVDTICDFFTEIKMKLIAYRVGTAEFAEAINVIDEELQHYAVGMFDEPEKKMEAPA